VFAGSNPALGIFCKLAKVYTGNEFKVASCGGNSSKINDLEGKILALRQSEKLSQISK
jgi:hypothetical protein